MIYVIRCNPNPEMSMAGSSKLVPQNNTQTGSKTSFTLPHTFQPSLSITQTWKRNENSVQYLQKNEGRRDMAKRFAILPECLSIGGASDVSKNVKQLCGGWLHSPDCYVLGQPFIHGSQYHRKNLLLIKINDLIWTDQD